MIMLFSMTVMPWICFISWWPWHDLTMIIPWRVWINMIIPCHSMIVMFDHGCQPGRAANYGSFFEASNVELKTWKISQQQTKNLAVDRLIWNICKVVKNGFCNIYIYTKLRGSFNQWINTIETHWYLAFVVRMPSATYIVSSQAN